MRYNYLADSYEKLFHPSFKEDDDIGIINWRHDGWWNCYYGEIKDIQAKDKLLKIYYSSKKIRKDFKHTKLCLTLAYRLAESGDIYLARKILKKEKHFLRFKVMKGIESSFISKFIKTFESYIRWNINIEIFLYKSAKRINEKRRRLKKINKLNSNKKLLIYNILNDIFINRKLDSADTRPQHLLRIAEIKVDLYLLTKNKIKKEKFIDQIKSVYIQFLKTIGSYYGKNSVTINYFMLMEFFFSLSYFLEKIYGINIQNY